MLASMSPPSPDEVTKRAKDALYVSVGLGVIAFQKAQVQRRALAKAAEQRVKTIEERLRAAVSRGAA